VLNVDRQFVAAAVRCAGKRRRESMELGKQALLYVGLKKSQVMWMNRREMLALFHP
jgi:hypothetical protein